MSAKRLHLDTPLAKALFKFFHHVEQDVVRAGAAPGVIRAYIFGGCAVHIHTNSRGSNDIDVEFNSTRWLNRQEVIVTKPAVEYEAGGRTMRLVLDQNFTTMLGPLHEDYQEDAIPLQRDEAASPLWIYVVTPEDLAVSKLGRFGDGDREDILTLLRMRKMTVESFTKRAKEAISLLCGKSRNCDG